LTQRRARLPLAPARADPKQALATPPNRLTQTTQGGPTIGYADNTAAGTPALTHPGGRITVEPLDIRNRLSAITKPSVNIVIHQDDPAYGVHHPLQHSGTGVPSVLIAGFTHAPDKEGNKLFEQHLHQQSPK
jgi:hypothetical protein